MQRDRKRLLGHGLLDLALILSALRHSEISLPSRRSIDEVIQRDSANDDGPLVGILTSQSHHFQQQTPWGAPGLSQKSVDNYDATNDEYERIMRDIRARPPVRQREDASENDNTDNVITMVLSIPNQTPSWGQNNGGVQVASRNPQSEGAVGGIGLPYSADENFDLFNSYSPGSMRDDEIDRLLFSESGNSADLALNHTFPDVDWQHFIAEYDNFISDSRTPVKGVDGGFGNWGNSDLLNEAIQSSELFLPVASSSQNSSIMDVSSSMPEEDVMTSARLEAIEYNDWASQNHESDLLFPSLPPPTYEEAMCMEQTNLTSENMATQEVEAVSDRHLLDHNYYNSTRVTPSDETTAQNTGYAIRSRHEVTTRVISAPPRPRLVSDNSESSTDGSVTIDLTSELSPPVVSRSSLRRITTSSNSSMEEVSEQSGYELNSFEIKPLDTSYFEYLNKDVSLHREVILCN